MKTRSGQSCCLDYIKLILKRGGRWRNKQIEEAIIREYGIEFQNNTIAKYLSFLIKDGKVLSAPAPAKNGSDKICFEYWLIEPIKNKKNDIPGTVEKMMETCLEIIKTYPDEHPQVPKIMDQYHVLEEMQRKGIVYV